MSETGPDIRVLVNGKTVAEQFPLAPGETVASFDKRLADNLGLPRTRRLLYRGRALSNPAEVFDANAGDAVYIIASDEQAVAAVKTLRSDPLVRGFSSSRSRYAARPASTARPRCTPYGFQAVRALPGYSDVAKAEKLLRAIASDRGFVRVMENRRWSVGALCEMEPEGKVGVDPVCVLGYNVNKGHEIHLRLRTDDRKGFRPMYLLKQVLAHELAHNVHSEHDSNFYDLMRQVEREARANDWTQSRGTAAGGGPALASSSLESGDPLEVEESASLSIARRLGSVSDEQGQMVDESALARGSAQVKPGSPGGLSSSSLHSSGGLALEEPGIIEIPHGNIAREEVRASAETTAVQIPESRCSNTEDGSAEEPCEAILSLQTPPVSSRDQTAPPPNSLNVLTGLGFRPGVARLALRECYGEQERAVDWLLNAETYGTPHESIDDGESQANAFLRNLNAALSTLQGEAETALDMENALLVLHLLTFNIVRHPEVPRYRRINTGNSGFHRSVGRYASTSDILQAIGYVLRDGFWTLDGSVDPARMWVAKSVIIQRLLHCE